MDLKLRGKVALVTGAGGDAMGTGVCLEMAREGASVVANDIDRAWADRVAGQVRGLGARSIATCADVSRLDDCRAMAAQAEARCAELGCRELWLTVNKHNTGSIAFYERMGFRKTGALVTDIGHGFVMDDWRMAKPCQRTLPEGGNPLTGPPEGC